MEEYRKSILKEIEAVVKTAVGYYISARTVDFTFAFINLCCISIGIFLGIKLVTLDKFLYVYILQLITLLAVAYWAATVLVSAESLLVSATRCLEVTKIPIEEGN